MAPRIDLPAGANDSRGGRRWEAVRGVTASGSRSKGPELPVSEMGTVLNPDVKGCRM